MKVFLVFLVLKMFDFGLTLNENCTESSNCTVQEKSICLLNICSCDPTLWEYNEDQKKCVKYATEYGSICYNDTQCTPFLGNGSACLNNICVCADDYRWYRGSCQKYAGKGQNCTAVNCLDPVNPLALTCRDDTCQCSDGYYDRGDDCRLKSEAKKDCAISNDCFPTEDVFGVAVTSHCELGTCIEDTKQSSLFNKNYTNLTNFNSASTFKNLHAIVLNVDNEACPNGVLSNLTQEECNNCQNTTYFLNTTCICQPGFFLENFTCIAELGMKDGTAQYTNDTDCPIKPGKLVNGTCYCKDYWFQSSTNRECKKTTLQYTQNCMDNEWCLAMGQYAYCDADTEKCQCISQAVLNDTSYYCNLKEGANLTGICQSDSQCGLYETCVDEKCQCSDGFYKVDDDGLCLPKIGYSCEIRDCTHIDGAVCSSNELCDCGGDGYVTDGFLCRKPATKLKEICEIEQQCKNIPNSACLQDSTTTNNASRCLCTDEYLEVNGTCYVRKSPGSLCSTSSDCTIILGYTFVCRNMLCQCPIGQSLNQANICVGSSAESLSLNAIWAVALSLLLIFRS